MSQCAMLNVNYMQRMFHKDNACGQVKSTYAHLYQVTCGIVRLERSVPVVLSCNLR